MLVPAAVAARVLGAGTIPLFVLATAALVPLAWLISRGTEEAAHHTGPALGGLLNATFANVPEILISLFALADGLYDVVRGSLSGSVVGNLLLVLGLALAVGGRCELDRVAAFQSLALVGLAVPALVVVALPHLTTGDEDKAFGAVTLPVAAVLLAAYCVGVAYAIRKKRGDPPEEAAEEGSWSLRRSLAVLAAATVATALMAEIITGTITAFAESVGISEFFTAAVILALAGNAAENGAAVIVAAHGELKLATDAALESAAQVAAFVIPAIAILSWALEPLPLAFSPIELAVLGASAMLAMLLLARGRGSRARGLVLVGAYVLAAAAFLLE